VFVPPGGAGPGGEPIPFVLMLHGAGGDGRGALGPFLERAEEAGVILLGPDSRGRTWDVLLGGYGLDVAFIDRALEQTFRRYAIDPDRVAVEGFSDGASYALGLGTANGDLFRRVVAFSPGYVPQSPAVGQPAIYVSHGVGDTVLPIDRCSRRIVPALRARGYDVRYHEFAGGHDVPVDISAEAFAWLRGE
jgi:phospholipase/carboxylesterase